jgi:hypothetical protein
VVGELPGQPFVRDIGLGHDQQARGILVDAMDDPRPRDAADARKLATAMVQQGVDQRTIGIARRRVDDQPRRLVDHDQVRVFVNDRQRNILGHRFRRRRFRHADGVRRTRRGLGRGLRRDAPGDFDLAFLDQRLDPLARQA